MGSSGIADRVNYKANTEYRIRDTGHSDTKY